MRMRKELYKLMLHSTYHYTHNVQWVMSTLAVANHCCSNICTLFRTEYIQWSWTWAEVQQHGWPIFLRGKKGLLHGYWVDWEAALMCTQYNSDIYQNCPLSCRTGIHLSLKVQHSVAFMVTCDSHWWVDMTWVLSLCKHTCACTSTLVPALDKVVVLPGISLGLFSIAAKLMAAYQLSATRYRYTCTCRE